MVVLPIMPIINKSLSPVKRCVAFPSQANESKKLSLGSLQISMLELTNINSAFELIFFNKSCKSILVKYFLNFGLLATSINSSMRFWLKSNTTRSFFSKPSIFE